MGRYRPPQPPGSFYITPDGYQRLQQEHDYLWRDKRPRVTQAVSEAAAMGDRSENAEYIYGKKMLREIDSRLRFLRKRLDQLTVVNRIPDDTTKVFFGAWVRLEDQQGELHEYRIVGPDETDSVKGWISMDAPLGRALLKKTEGEDVTVQLPRGETEYHILKVAYLPFDNSN